MPMDTSGVVEKKPESAAVLPSVLREYVVKLCDELGYANPRFIESTGCNPGDGFVSLMVRMKVTCEKDPTLKPLHLIIKVTPQGTKRREYIKCDRIFQNETNLYKLVLPSFAELLHEKGVIKNPYYPNVARYFGSNLKGDASDCLVLEDLTARGFALADRRVGLSREHCELVLVALARLHSTSRAYEFQKPKEFEHLRSNVRELLAGSNTMLEDFGKFAVASLDTAKNRFPEGSVEYEKLRNLLTNFENVGRESVKPSPDGFNVINHGDCWTNNMMFKINPTTSKPEEVVLIDWQVSRYCSPAMDLGYFVFMTTERKTRDHLTDLLQLYVDHFNRNLLALGCPEETFINLETVNNHMKRYARAGIAFASYAVRVLVSEMSNMGDLDKSFEDGVEFAEMFKNVEVEHSKQSAAEQRLYDIVEDAVALQYI